MRSAFSPVSLTSAPLLQPKRSEIRPLRQPAFSGIPKRDTVQFGHWGPYNQALGLFAVLASYAPIDLDTSFRKLTPRQQAQTQVWVETVSPTDLKSLAKDQKIGVLEECADQFFETHIYSTIQSGIVRQEQVDERREWVREMQAQKVPFAQMAYRLGELISEPEIRSYQQLIGSKDKTLAHKLLTLVNLKFILAGINGQPPNILEETRSRMFDETEEFLERVTGSPMLSKMLVRLQTHLVNWFPQLPVEKLQWLPQRMVRSVLGDKLAPNHQTMLEYLYQKHYNRNELDYSTYPRYSYTERKKILKPIEVMMEAAILKAVETAKDAVLDKIIPLRPPVNP
jgi:hypothetical protein